MDVVEAQFIEHVEIEVGEIADVIEPVRHLRAAEAGMLRHDDIEPLRQLLHERQPRTRAICAM